MKMKTKKTTKKKKTTKTSDAWWTIVIAPSGEHHILPTMAMKLFDKKSEALKMKAFLESRDDILHFAPEDDAEAEAGVIGYISIGHVLDPRCRCQPYYDGKTLVHNIIQ